MKIVVTKKKVKNDLMCTGVCQVRLRSAALCGALTGGAQPGRCRLRRGAPYYTPYKNKDAYGCTLRSRK